MASTELVSLKDKIKSIRSLLQRAKDEFADALPRHIKVEQFLRVAMTTMQTNPKLLDCTQQSVMGSLMESAQLGLQVDGLLGEAYLIPFKNKVPGGGYRLECQLIPGYKGYMKLARNTGEVSTIKAEVVFHSDQLTVIDGLDPKLEHVRSEDPPVKADEPIEKAVRGAYAIARMRDGGVTFVFLWKWEIDRARNRSRAKDSGPWVTDYPEMAKKTAIRRLAKYIPQSSELQRVVAMEDRSEAGLSQRLGENVIDLKAGNGGDADEAKSKLDLLVNGAAGGTDPQEKPDTKPEAEPPKRAQRARNGKPKAEASGESGKKDEKPLIDPDTGEIIQNTVGTGDLDFN